MNDSIHVEIEIVEFHVVRVRLAGIDRDRDALDHDRFFFDHVNNNQRILLCEPPIERWNPHLRQKLEILHKMKKTLEMEKETKQTLGERKEERGVGVSYL
ncbi:hypothetical protein MRB53_020586 [Persea americana]|uniref:Uncharacterized protein n=1 Tax=Persea americana TaxID=3435 RepID=A0ACC2L1D2_PERAE|nr:hypothetical protein MRB53_020586 [Persea americana]